MKLSKKQIFGLIVTLLIIILLTVLYFYLKSKGYLKIFTSVEQLRSFLNKFGIGAPIMYLLILILSVIAAPIPNNVLAIAGGAMFGTITSFFINVIGITAGSLIAFALARKFGKALVYKFVSQKVISKYENISQAKQDIFLILVFLLPFLPDDAICFIAGLGSIKITRFLVIVLLTRPWGLLMASFLGSGTLSIPIWGWALIALLFAAILLLGLKYGSRIEDHLIKKFQKKSAKSTNI